MRNLTLVCIAAILLPLLGFGQDKPDDPQALFKQFETSVVESISAGDQDSAEKAVDTAPAAIKYYQHFQFIDASLTRSRFLVPEALDKYKNVLLQYPYNIDGYSSFLIREMDLGINEKENWIELKKLADKNDTNIWLRWMLCVEARNLGLNTEGAAEYAKLFGMVKSGTSLMHQTFANILDELGRHDEALEHRYSAVKLEDKSWSRDGLANTLAALNKFDEAAVNYQKAIEMNPKDSNSMVNYCLMLLQQGKYTEAESVITQATQVDPSSVKAVFFLGYTYEKENFLGLAIENYKKCLLLDPKYVDAINGLKRLEKGKSGG
jgi:tetratricopeptide (TPR) repeat protein